MSDHGPGEEIVTEESPWRYPAIIISLTLILSGLVAYYYFGPPIPGFGGGLPRASARELPIHMEIGESRFVISENYTQYPRDRRDGVRDGVSLYTMFPTHEGYTARHSELFQISENDPEPRDRLLAGGRFVVHFEVHIRRLPMSEADRVEHIYRERLADPEGDAFNDELTQYTFDPESSYADQDLFLGEEANGDVVAILCTQRSNVVRNPNCRRTLDLPDGLRLSYRFKRTQLEQWREINDGVIELLDSWRTP